MAIKLLTGNCGFFVLFSVLIATITASERVEKSSLETKSNSSRFRLNIENSSYFLPCLSFGSFIFLLYFIGYAIGFLDDRIILNDRSSFQDDQAAKVIHIT